jgi:hypothetical protein
MERISTSGQGANVTGNRGRRLCRTFAALTGVLVAVALGSSGGRVAIAAPAAAPGSVPAAPSAPTTGSAAPAANLKVTVDPTWDRGREQPADAKGCKGIIALAAAADGSVYALDSRCRAVLVRYTSSGAVDPTFRSPRHLEAAEQSYLLPQANGTLVVVLGSRPHPLVERLLHSGRIDPAFARGKAAKLPSLGREPSLASAISGPDGTILLAFNSFACPPVGARGLTECPSKIVRLTAQGTPDPAFGHGGVVTIYTPEGPTASASEILAIAATPLGEVMVSTDAGTLLRYTASGDPDPAFGVGGSVTVPPSEALLPEPDGSTLAASSAEALSAADVSAAGALNPLAGPSGVDTTFADTPSPYTGFYADPITLLRVGSEVLGIDGLDALPFTPSGAASGPPVKLPRVVVGLFPRQNPPNASVFAQSPDGRIFAGGYDGYDSKVQLVALDVTGT